MDRIISMFIHAFLRFSCSQNIRNCVGGGLFAMFGSSHVSIVHSRHVAAYLLTQL